MRSGLFGIRNTGSGGDKYSIEWDGVDFYDGSADDYNIKQCESGLVYQYDDNGANRIGYKALTSYFTYNLGVYYEKNEPNNPFDQHWAVDYVDCVPKWLLDETDDDELEKELPYPEHWLKPKPLESKIELGKDKVIVSIIVDKLLCRKSQSASNARPIRIFGDDIEDCKRIMVKALKCLPRRLSNTYSFCLSADRVIVGLDVFCSTRDKDIGGVDLLDIDLKDVVYEYKHSFAKWLSSADTYKPISDERLGERRELLAIIAYLDQNVINEVLNNELSYNDRYLAPILELLQKQNDSESMPIDTKADICQIAYGIWFNHYNDVSQKISNEFKQYFFKENSVEFISALRSGSRGVKVKTSDIVGVLNNFSGDSNRAKEYVEFLYNAWKQPTDAYVPLASESIKELFESYYNDILEFCSKYGITGDSQKTLEYLASVQAKDKLTKDAFGHVIGIVNTLDGKVKLFQIESAEILFDYNDPNTLSQDDFAVLEGFSKIAPFVKNEILKKRVHELFRKYLETWEESYSGVFKRSRVDRSLIKIAEIKEKMSSVKVVAKQIDYDIDNDDIYKRALDFIIGDEKEKENKANVENMSKNFSGYLNRLASGLPFFGKIGRRSSSSEELEYWSGKRVVERKYGKAGIIKNALGSGVRLVVTTSAGLIFGILAMFLCLFALKLINDNGYLAMPYTLIKWVSFGYWLVYLIIRSVIGLKALTVYVNTPHKKTAKQIIVLDVVIFWAFALVWLACIFTVSYIRFIV